MGVQSKVDEATKKRIVEQRFKHEMSVKQIAKMHGIAVPTVYNYLRDEMEANASRVKARSSAGLDSTGGAVNIEARVVQLEQENDALKRRLLDLMTKHNEW